MFAGAVGAPLGVDQSSGDLSLDRAIGDLDVVSTQAKDTLAKSTNFDYDELCSRFDGTRLRDHPQTPFRSWDRG